MLAHRILALRRKAGMSQAQLAEALHISASTVGMYEQGRRTPNLDTLVAISKVFHVSLDYLITGEEFKTESEPDNRSSDTIRCPCNTCFWRDLIPK